MTNVWQYWTMDFPLLLEFLLCPVVLLCLLFVAAPYGRHFRSGWGPSLPNRTAWFLMELPALLVICVLVMSSPAAGSPQAWVPLSLWVFHYAYRTFLFPALMRPSVRTFPLVLVFFAVGFNTLNGLNNANALIGAGVINDPLLSLHFVTGCMIFCLGFGVHFHSDRIIQRLREHDDTGYHVPQGGLFRWVGSPHYLGEIIQWFGWAVMTWSLAGLAFALFTFCNLAPRALSNHRWYRRNFPDYPPDRRVLIPAVF